jgi:hypothetical protein
MFELFQALKLDFRKAQVERELHSTEVYRGELKRLQQSQKQKLFSNSCMLPQMRNFCVSDEDGVSYWRDHKGPVTFDCCPMHRSAKQNLLRVGAEPINYEYESTAAERALKKYRSSTHNEIRAKAGIEPGSTHDKNALRKRIFQAGDCDSLHYQLRLIDDRLQAMLTRKLLAENFAPPPPPPPPPLATVERGVQPIDASRAGKTGPVDIWYDLAENKTTPPVMLRWLTEHRNPYIANRANKTLNLPKAS